MDPARPLLISNDFLPDVGGIQQYVSQVARRLDGAGVLAPAHDHAHELDATLPYPVWRGRRRYLWPVSGTARVLRAAIATHDAGVVVFMAPAPLAPLGPRAGRPWAVCTHGAELVLPARIPGLGAVYRRFLRSADCLYTVSAYTGKVLRELVGLDGPPIRFLRNGVDLEAFHPDVETAFVRRRYGIDDAPLILCVGRLVRRKGQDVLIAALPRIRAAVPGARLLLVGDGPDRKRLERAARRLPTDAVIFAGKVPWSELPAHYAAADLFAHPNRARWGGLEQEGFGVVFLEAQASGTPVIAGFTGGSPEALVHDRTGMLVDGTSVEQVADAIGALLSDGARLQEMAAAARDHVERAWSWDRIVGRFQHDLARLAAGQRLDSEL